MDIKLSREEIDSIDKRMIDLFKQRMACSANIAQYKKENNMPVFDSARESQLINKNVEYLNDYEMEKYYREFFEGMLKVSKDYQRDLLGL